MTIEPLFDNVLIKPLELDSGKLAGGIELPPTDDKDKPLFGEIIAVSKGEWYEKGQKIVNPLSVEVGDKVLYRKWSMAEIRKDGQDYVTVNQKDITAIIHD